MQTMQKTVTPIIPKAMIVEIPVSRYAAYCRVSSDSREQELSFAAQVKYYTEYIGKIENAELVDIYADEAVSGRGTKKRDDFNRLIADCKKGKIDRVITKSVSRFARNTVDCLMTVRMLAECGVSILFEKEGIDTATMSSEVLLAMSGTQAQDESISHGNNMRWSYQAKMKNGSFLGSSPAFGYTLVSSTEHTINEEEATTVRLIKDLYLQGMGKQKIADHLNERGITNRGHRWTAFAIHYILNNERYTGDALLQKTISTNEWPPRKMKNDGSQPQYYVENALPAIFTKEDRAAILALQASRQRAINETGGHELSRMLICSHCGHTFRRVKRKYEAVWKCAYAVAGRSQCEQHQVLESDVQAAFLRCINTLRQHSNMILTPLIEQIEALQSRVNGTQNKIHTIDKEIATLSKQSLVIAELLSNGILETVDFAAQNAELGERINRLRSQRLECLRQNESDEQLKDLREVADFLADMDSDLTEYDEELIRSVIVNAKVVSNSELTIQIKGGLELTEHLPHYQDRRCKTK